MSSTDPLRATRDLSGQRPATTRRAVLRSGALTLAVLGGAACDASGARRDGSASSSVSPSGPPGQPVDETGDETGDDESVDARLAVEALGQVDVALGLGAAVAARHPGLAPALEGLLRAQEAHRALLADAAPEAEAPGSVTSPPDEARAWSALRQRETTLQTVLGTLALQARSGPFARLLAVMAASVAQHLAALPATPPAGPLAGSPTPGPAA